MVSLKKAVSSLTALMFLLMVGSTANAAIFTEDFETIPLDTTNWKADNGGAGTALSTDAAPADEFARFVNTVTTEGSGAVLLGDGDGNGSNYCRVHDPGRPRQWRACPGGIMGWQRYSV